MTSEEFWKDDPELFNSYRTSFINKSKNEIELWNYKCWVQGFYNYEGNITSANKLSYEISLMLGNKGQKAPKIEYPNKPHNLQKEEQKQTKEEIKEKNRKQYFNDFNYFATMKQRFIEEVKEGKR